MNVVQLVGRLGFDPELRHTPSGMAVCDLRVATQDRKAHTEWHRVTVWDKAAENVAKHKRKGDMLAVVGELRTEEWTDKEGVKRWVTKIHTRKVEFLPGGGGEQRRTAREEPPVSAAGADDDIPF